MLRSFRKNWHRHQHLVAYLTLHSLHHLVSRKQLKSHDIKTHLRLRLKALIRRKCFFLPVGFQIVVSSFLCRARWPSNPSLIADATAATFMKGSVKNKVFILFYFPMKKQTFQSRTTAMLFRFQFQSKNGPLTFHWLQLPPATNSSTYQILCLTSVFPK